jgi:hypothetical protein
MDQDLTRSPGRAVTIGAAALVAVATVCWETRSVYGPSLAPAVADGPSMPAPAPAAEPGDPRPLTRREDLEPIPDPGPMPGDTEAAVVVDYVVEKYRFLLAGLRGLDAGQVAQLRRLLLTRELAVGQATADDSLPKAETAIRALLHPADHAVYELLRDADEELFRLNEYAAGIHEVAPLDAADRQSILMTKLAYRQRFRQLVQDSGLQGDYLGPAEREHAYALAARALGEYQRAYLQEVRQYLAGEEQYALLGNYEASEFTAELARLRSKAGVPMPGGS